MNLRSHSLAAATAALLLPTASAGVSVVVRPDYQNLTAASGSLQTKNATVVHIQGHIKPVASAPGDGALRLTEAAFGQPLAQWVPDSGTAAFAASIASQVRTALYPPAGASRTTVENGSAAFRFYSSPTYNDVFVSADTQGTSIDLAYTDKTARSPTGEGILGTTFQINAFNQRSVAATRWVLTINPSQVDINQLKDIEIIVKHRFSDRIAPICP